MSDLEDRMILFRSAKTKEWTRRLGEFIEADAIYRATSEEELGAVQRSGAARGIDEFVWAVVYRHGTVSLERLAELVKIAPKELATILERAIAAGRIQSVEVDGVAHYKSSRLVVERGATVGWEASVYDHFQAMVRTIPRLVPFTQRKMSCPVNVISHNQKK